MMLTELENNDPNDKLPAANAKPAQKEVGRNSSLDAKLQYNTHDHHRNYDKRSERKPIATMIEPLRSTESRPMMSFKTVSNFKSSKASSPVSSHQV